MVKASLIIIFKDGKIFLEGNDNLIWYINEKIKNRTLVDILKVVKEYKDRYLKRRINIMLVNLPKEEKDKVRRFSNDFNFYFQKSLQKKITQFLP